MGPPTAMALQDSAGRFVPALIAVLVYLATMALAAMLLVGGSAERWRAERESRLTVQLAPLHAGCAAGGHSTGRSPRSALFPRWRGRSRYRKPDWRRCSGPGSRRRWKAGQACRRSLMWN